MFARVRFLILSIFFLPLVCTLTSCSGSGGDAAGPSIKLSPENQFWLDQRAAEVDAVAPKGEMPSVNQQLKAKLVSIAIDRQAEDDREAKHAQQFAAKTAAFEKIKKEQDDRDRNWSIPFVQSIGNTVVTIVGFILSTFIALKMLERRREPQSHARPNASVRSRSGIWLPDQWK